MATIRTAIELYDNFSAPLMSVIQAVNMSVSAMEQMQRTMDSPVDTASLQGIREQLNEATLAVQELDAAMQQVESPAIDSPTAPVNSAPVEIPIEPTVPDPLVETPAPVEVPIEWQSDNLEVFTGTGIERFEQEVQSTNEMLNTLNNTQNQIAAQAGQTQIFPANMISDLGNMQTRIQAIQERIQTIENNPMNLGTDTANAELEQMRASLNQAILEQQELNTAVENMDVRSANEAYMRLSSTVSNTERYIRDNVNEQGRFNREIENGTDAASNLKSMIAGAISAYAGIAGIKKAFSFVEDCTEAFNTQLNAENQLMVVLGNMLDEDYVSQFTIETDADTTAAVDEINAIQNSVDEVVVPVTAESKALQAEFDTITAKAAEIQSNGIYGDEAMIAAGAEFATYFTDTDAITSMMDTLADYAMGMSGGGEIDSTAMVDYATNLGKIMSGSYDAMTKKGFEFSDAQKAIIEGTATQEQLVAVLGDDYASMSDEMQAAAVISQIIEESWGGLYETMSNTPEGKIIQMTNAWGDMKEVIGGQLYPYVILFVDAINENWATIESVISAITTGLEYMLGVLSWLMEGAFNFAQVIIDNWSWISPIIYGITAALALYAAYLGITKAAEIASAAGKAILIVAEYAHAAATGAAVSATTAETAAQMGLNTALLECPLTWIIVLIIALIALFYAAVAAVNKFAGTSVSATGIICGVFMVAAAFIGNLFVTLINFVIDIFVVLWNFIAAFANFFANVFTDPVGAIARLFFDLVDTILSLLQSLASAIDTIFGSNLSGAVSGWRDSLGSWVDSTFGQGEEIMAKVNAEDYHLDRFEYSSAWDAGYSFGEGIDESIENFDPSSLFGTTDIPTADDYASAFTGGTSGIGDDVSDIAGNTGSIADSMDITDEELEYLRDIAEQEAINRFTTAEIKIDQTNHNNVSSGMDLDGVVSGLTDAVNEAVDIITEGVHE
jgi:cytochrome c1